MNDEYNFGLRPLFHGHDLDIKQGLCLCMILLVTHLRNDGGIGAVVGDATDQMQDHKLV
jgi:hypothetical protein